VGRVCPRHSGGGRPLNSVVSHHEKAGVRQATLILLAFAIFAACWWYDDRKPINPLKPLAGGLVLVVLGCVNHRIFAMGEPMNFENLLSLSEWGSGSRPIALGYGFIAFSIYKALQTLRKRLRDG
jgi:hypothetical protein